MANSGKDKPEYVEGPPPPSSRRLLGFGLLQGHFVNTQRDERNGTERNWTKYT